LGCGNYRFWFGCWETLMAWHTLFVKGFKVSYEGDILRNLL
jgi:hypothetical protein